MSTLNEWLEQYGGGEIEVRELAESLVDGPERSPSLRDEQALCGAAKRLLEAMDHFDSELERVGYGEESTGELL
jgi:hypothetical protein